MKNLIKVVLIATAFAFAAGCSCNECPAKCPCPTPNPCKPKCVKHYPCGKLGVEKRKCDTCK